jgi:hypothetical protein
VLPAFCSLFWRDGVLLRVIAFNEKEQMMPSQDWPNWIDWNVWVRDGCRCVYCGLDGTDWRMWFQLCIDHIIPRVAVLTEQRLRVEGQLNKAVACHGCNVTKGAYDPRGTERTIELTESYRLVLIDRAKMHIEERKEQTYQAAFKAMMSDVQAAARAHG